MPDKVPFFTLFESFQAPRQLRLLLHDTVALGGVLDRAARTLEMQLESGEPIPDAARSALQQMLAEQYDLRRVQLTFRDKSAPVKGSGEVLLGKEFKGKATPISELNLKMGMAVVEGRLQLRDWTDKDGGKRRSAEVIADNVYFGDSKPKDGGEEDDVPAYTGAPDSFAVPDSTS